MSWIAASKMGGNICYFPDGGLSGLLRTKFTGPCGPACRCPHTLWNTFVDGREKNLQFIYFRVRVPRERDCDHLSAGFNTLGISCSSAAQETKTRKTKTRTSSD